MIVLIISRKVFRQVPSKDRIGSKVKGQRSKVKNQKSKIKSQHYTHKITYNTNINLSIKITIMVGTQGTTKNTLMGVYKLSGP